MNVLQEELESKAREINNLVFGRDRKRRRQALEYVKEQADAGAKFALEKALMISGISPTARDAFVGLLREEKDAINILFVSQGLKPKSVELLKPIFGYKSGEFLDAFQDAFKKLQVEIALDMKRQDAV